MNHRGRPGGRAPIGGTRSGLRERNKEKKLERIVRAGRALFVQKGFDETTTRAIAAKAGVAAGTFFLYFKEKRELLFHLFKDEVSAVQEKALASVPGDAPLVEQIGHVFGRFYAYYARDPRLSRVFMKEILFLEEGESDDMLALTLGFVAHIAKLVARAKDRGEIEPSVDPMQVAAHAFALYVFGVVGYLNGAFPTPDLARAQLEHQLELLMRGLARSRGERRARARSRRSARNERSNHHLALPPPGRAERLKSGARTRSRQWCQASGVRLHAASTESGDVRGRLRTRAEKEGR